MQKKKRIVQILRIIILIVGIIFIVIFPPWDGIWAWIKPLPDTVQEQVDDAVGHGLDGIIVYVDERAIYSSIYEYEHTGWLPGYYSIARYHEEIDTVVVQFVNTTGGTPIVPLVDTLGGTKVMVSNVVYNRIVWILRGEIDMDQ